MLFKKAFKLMTAVLAASIVVGCTTVEFNHNIAMLNEYINDPVNTHKKYTKLEEERLKNEEGYVPAVYAKSKDGYCIFSAKVVDSPNTQKYCDTVRVNNFEYYKGMWRTKAPSKQAVNASSNAQNKPKPKVDVKKQQEARVYPNATLKTKDKEYKNATIVVLPKASDYTGPTANKKQSVDDAIKQAIDAATPAN